MTLKEYMDRPWVQRVSTLGWRYVPYKMAFIDREALRDERRAEWLGKLRKLEREIDDSYMLNVVEGVLANDGEEARYAVAIVQRERVERRGLRALREWDR